MFEKDKSSIKKITNLLKDVANNYFASGGKPVSEEELREDILKAEQEARQMRINEWLKEQEIKYGPLSQETLDYAEKTWNNRRKRAN